jgi:hypothetical protein
MWNLVQEIFAQPDVTGTCVFDKKGGQLCAKGHEKLAAGLLDTLGLHTARLFQMGKMSGLKINMAQFIFDRYVVLAQQVPSGEIFLVLCLTHADYDQIAKNINTKIVEALPIELAPSLEEAVEKNTEPRPEPEPPEACSPHLQIMLDKIEQALAGAIGPVAGMVMQDYIDLWRQGGPTVPARLVELTNMLVDEIGEPEAAQDFVAQIEQIV